MIKWKIRVGEGLGGKNKQTPNMSRRAPLGRCGNSPLFQTKIKSKQLLSVLLGHHIVELKSF